MTNRAALDEWIARAVLTIGETDMTMFDSTDWLAIPANAPIVAGYCDGTYKWPPEAWTRFSGIKLTITVFGQAGANICDCEPGDLSPANAAAWAKGEVGAGRQPMIYCDRTRWAQTAPLVIGLPLTWWIADPTGIPHIVPGSTATQWNWLPTEDVSSVIAGWPHPIVTPIHVPPAPPVPPLIVATMTDKDLGAMKKTLLMVPVANGCGWVQTGIPFDSVISLDKQGSDPAVDGGYWAGSAQGQDRGGQLLLSLTDCRTGDPEHLVALTGSAGAFVTTVT